MGKILTFPVDFEAQVEKEMESFIAEAAKNRRCVLCGEALAEDESTFCGTCLKQKNRVRCINPKCKHTHVIFNLISEVHKNLRQKLGIGEKTGALVTACYRCDPKRRQRRIIFKLI